MEVKRVWLSITDWAVPLEAEGTPWNRLIARRLDCRPDEVMGWRIRRRSVDARKKPRIMLIYAVDAEINRNAEWTHSLLQNDPHVSPVNEAPTETIAPGLEPLRGRPVVVGFGPAGLFCALRLALAGYRPVVFEQGRPVQERAADVDRFWNGGELDPLSNVQFGEGGAGAFSDGKLMTRVKDPRTRDVLEWLVRAGGPPEIAYEQKPHIGTDRLRPVVARLREEIIKAGGTVRLGTRVTRLDLENGRCSGLVLGDGTEQTASVAVLAVGNCGREMFESLHRSGVQLQQKAFAMGVRIEHPQAMIDESQYGTAVGHPALGHAEYRLTYRHPSSGRSVYSFCMCPGGEVIAAASEPGGVVTNGMSRYDRSSGTANSALVVTVTPEDFSDDSPLAGVEFQRIWERAAYRLAGSDYRAPAQTVGDFMAGRKATAPDTIAPSYRPGVRPAELDECLPDFVSEALRDALTQFGRQIKGFARHDAVLTGVETRTSSPVRILRGEDGQALGMDGLYPAGEGAGYAGGIVSAALDGWNIAGAIIRRFARPGPNV